MTVKSTIVVYAALFCAVTTLHPKPADDFNLLYCDSSIAEEFYKQDDLLHSQQYLIDTPLSVITSFLPSYWIVAPQVVRELNLSLNQIKVSLHEETALSEDFYQQLKDKVTPIFDKAIATLSPHEQEMVRSQIVEAQKKLLVDNFYRQRSAGYKSIAWDMTGYVGENFASAAAGAAATYFLSQYIATKLNANNSWTKSLVLANTITSVISGALTAAIPGYIYLARKWVSGAPGKSELERYEQEYIQKKPSLPIDLQKAIENNFMQAHCRATTNGSGQESVTTIQARHLDFAKKALSLPHTASPITYNEETLKKSFEGFAPEMVSTFRLFCLKHALASEDMDVRDEFAEQKKALYFEGEAGTGKTYAAEKIAQALNVPFRKITISNTQDLLGTAETPGKLLQAITEQGSTTNMILLIDDIHVALNDVLGQGTSIFLNLFDPRQKTFESPYLGGAKIDISHLGIIVTANALPNNKALLDRFNVVKFPPLTAELKKSIIWNQYFPAKLALYNRKHKPLLESDFTQADIDMINDLIDEDLSPGLRTLQSKLDTYFISKMDCTHYHDGDHYQCLEEHLKQQGPGESFDAKVSQLSRIVATDRPLTTKEVDLLFKIIESEYKSLSVEQRAEVRATLTTYAPTSKQGKQAFQMLVGAGASAGTGIAPAAAQQVPSREELLQDLEALEKMYKGMGFPE